MTDRHWLLGALLFGWAAAAPAALVPPPGFAAPVQQGAAEEADVDCRAPPKPFTGKLDFPSKYEGADESRDKVNPKAEAENEAKTADIREMEKQVSAMVSRYLHTGRPEILQCTLDWLDTWAAAGALTGKAQNHPGKSMRKWALGSLASAYLRLKFSVSQPLKSDPQRAQRIESWFGKLAGLVIKDWEGRELEDVNNHQYWAAWSIMATAVVLDRREYFDWALAQHRTAMTQIDPEGYLPNELARETRALAYHNYALGPLAMLAAFAKANGVDVRDDGAALRRLAGRVLQGVDNPKVFESKTGRKQTLEGVNENSKFAWMEAYCWTYACGPNLTQRMSSMRPFKTYRLGGNVTELFAPGAAKGKNDRAAAPTATADGRPRR
jgi:poly(beta-D-mannuronate) lyase